MLYGCFRFWPEKKAHWCRGSHFTWYLRSLFQGPFCHAGENISMVFLQQICTIKRRHVLLWVFCNRWCETVRYKRLVITNIMLVLQRNLNRCGQKVGIFPASNYERLIEDTYKWTLDWHQLVDNDGGLFRQWAPMPQLYTALQPGCVKRWAQVTAVWCSDWTTDWRVLWRRSSAVNHDINRAPCSVNVCACLLV